MQKVSRLAETSASEFADWAGAVSGKLGQRTSNGFEVIDAGIQIFEKKANVVKPDVGSNSKFNDGAFLRKNNLSQ